MTATSIENVLDFVCDLNALVGVHQHPVDQPSAAICQEPLEVLTLFSRCPSDTLICVYVYHSPVFLAGDQVAVVTVLGGEGVGHQRRS